MNSHNHPMTVYPAGSRAESAFRGVARIGRGGLPHRSLTPRLRHPLDRARGRPPLSRERGPGVPPTASRLREPKGVSALLLALAQLVPGVGDGPN